MSEFGSFLVNVELEGLTPLLMNAKNPEVLEGRINMKSLDPEQQAALAMYVNEEGEPIVPARNLIRALYDVTPGQSWPGRGKTGLSRLVPLINFVGENYPLNNGSENGKVDAKLNSLWVTVGSGGHTRHRAEYFPWNISFQIRLLHGLMGLDKKEAYDLVHGMFEAVGIAVGIMDYRPAKKGTYGTFAVTKFERFENG